MPCTAGPTPSQPFDQLFSVANSVVNGINFATAGTGVRDFNTNITPAQLNLNLPPVARAFTATLYINLLQGTQTALTFIQVSVDGGPFVDVETSLLAWCGNTCWSAFNDGSNGSQNIYNLVYTADFFSIVEVGNHNYSIKLPGVAPDPEISTFSDTPHYPGCFGGQGIQLFVTYDDGSGEDRHFVWYHGAKLIAPNTPNPNWPGGNPSYSVNFNSVDPYTLNPTVFAAVGDSQTDYPDTFCFNGTCVPPNAFGSVWQGALGGMSNLLGNLTLDPGTGTVCTQPTNQATISATSDNADCLSWFLFAYLASDSTSACDCATPVPPLIGNLSVFKDITGFIDYIVGGAGTRDIKIDTDPVSFNVNVPGIPTEAYLYWNVIVDESIDASHAILNANNHLGSMIGKVGNTCWGPPQPDGSNPCIDCGIRNQVWRADVSAQIITAIPDGGIFTASITIPNVGDPVQPFATKASDQPRYPGCNGSQGVALLVIYDSPCEEKHIQIFDGAVLLVPTGAQSTYSGTNSYELDLNAIESEFNGCGRITLIVGDAQTTYADSFLWNGTPLPQNGNSSYANPDVGKLLMIGEHLVTISNLNTIEGTTTSDCLCWFLFGCSAYVQSCPENDCGPNDCHVAAPFDELYTFNRMVGNIDYVLAGAGIRDFDTNVTPAVINVSIPGPVIKAYLYWNTLGGGYPFCPDSAEFNGNDVSGSIIGCCGNTCWSVYCTDDGTDHDGNTPNNQLLNKVWFADVTSLVPGSGSYSVVLPDVHPSPLTAFASSDTPHYPGCCGGQGVALLVIYATAPNVIVRPRQHCCKPIPGEFVTEVLTREIIIWHGAKLVTPVGSIPTTIGGSPEYSISWTTKYNWLPKIATAVGDAQTSYADSFYYNGIQFPPQPSYFNPYAGNLLHVKAEFPPGHTTNCSCGPGGLPNTVTALTPNDCLCWFLFVWSGAIKCVTPAVSKSQRFISPPTQKVALWNPNPPNCCQVKLPCCGELCLPAKLNIGITAAHLGCACFANQNYTMTWNKTEQKYILQDTPSVCGCTLFGWFYCVGSQWTLYLGLVDGSTICADGVNANFPIGCNPFGGVGLLEFVSENPCSCSCVSDTLQINISSG